MNYKNQLKTSAWLRKKNEILSRDNFVCSICLCDNFESQIQVHHIAYLKNKKAWEYPDYFLVSLCKNCHENEHKTQNVFNTEKIKEWIIKLLLKK